MKRLFGFVLLFAVLLAPGASAALFSKNKGPKINYKKKYITQKYNNKKHKNNAAHFGMPKGKKAPKSNITH